MLPIWEKEKKFSHENCCPIWEKIPVEVAAWMVHRDNQFSFPGTCGIGWFCLQTHYGQPVKERVRFEVFLILENQVKLLLTRGKRLTLG